MPRPPHHRRLRPGVATRLALSCVAAVACVGCGLSAPEAAGSLSKAGTTAAAPAPPLAETTPLADPRDWDSPSTAVIDDPAVHPVVDHPRPHLPVTVTDAQGTTVTVTDTSRILALDIYGTLARTVFELGLGDRVVGRDVSTQFSEAQRLPLVTRGGHDLNAEAILALDPTVILTDTTLGPWGVILQLRDAGVPVVVLDSHRGLDDVSSLTTSVADALGVPAAGRRLAARTEAQIAQVRTQIAAVAPREVGDRLRMVFLYVRGKSGVYYLFGEGSGADSLIDALGGYDVAKEIHWSGMRPVTDEGLIAAQPDLILMMTDGLKSAGGVDGLLKRLPALGQTPAGEHHRFVDMADSEILGYGPLTAQVLNALGVSIYAPAAVAGSTTGSSR